MLILSRYIDMTEPICPKLRLLTPICLSVVNNKSIKEGVEKVRQIITIIVKNQSNYNSTEL